MIFRHFRDLAGTTVDGMIHEIYLQTLLSLPLNLYDIRPTVHPFLSEMQ